MTVTNLRLESKAKRHVWMKDVLQKLHCESAINWSMCDGQPDQHSVKMSSVHATTL